MSDDASAGALEARLRAVEDRLAILNLIASHSPSADTGADYYNSAVYTEDSVFDRGKGLDGAVGLRRSARSRGRRRIRRRSMAASPILPPCPTSSSTATAPGSRHICRFSTRTVKRRSANWPITARRTATASIASSPTAGASCALPMAGKSGAGTWSRSTAPSRHATSSPVRSRTTGRNRRRRCEIGSCAG